MKDNFEVLKNYYDLLYPEELEENEYVCLFFKWSDDKGGEYTTTEYAKNFDEYCEKIDKYRDKADVFNGLATVVPDKNGDLGRKEANVYRQSVLFIDFDKKDFPELGDVKDFIELIDSKVPKLFIHACYNSGHGYHFYVAMEPTKQVKPLNEMNKELVDIVGGDSKACCITQLARVPGTFNRKEMNVFGGYPYVMEVYNTRPDPDRFFPYPTSRVQRKIKEAKKKQGQSMVKAF